VQAVYCLINLLPACASIRRLFFSLAGGDYFHPVKLSAGGWFSLYLIAKMTVFFVVAEFTAALQGREFTQSRPLFRGQPFYA
jgi:hypothetical protein